MGGGDAMGYGRMNNAQQGQFQEMDMITRLTRMYTDVQQNQE